MAKLTTGVRLLRSLTRSGKAQRRTVSKLVSQMFAVPKPKRKTKTKPKLQPLAKSPVRAQAARAPSLAQSRVLPAPGKWLAAYYTPAQAGAMSGRRMNYWLYLPDHVADDAQPDGMPLVVMLHGCQQSATQFAQGTRMNLHAERRGWAVLYPQQLASAHAQRCWKWYDKATQEGGGDVAAIVGMIEKVATQYPIDRSRIYIAGISAGAGMADIVALNHPELIAAVGLHSGPVFGAGHSTVGALGVMQHGAAARADHAIEEMLQRRLAFPPMPAILIQGQGDKVVRPVNQLQLMRQRLMLNRLPLNMDSRPSSRSAGRNRNAHHTLDYFVGRKLMLRAVRIEQLEHAWSGGDAALAFHDKADPDASKAMLDFFARHRRVIG